MRSIPSMSDARLVSAHKAGDRQAMAVLMERHRDSLMGFLINRVGRDAEDLYQETWSKVSAKIDAYEERGSFRSWLFQVARRLVIDHHRRAAARITTVHPTQEPDAASTIDQPDQQVAAAQIAAIFDQAVEEMEPKMAEVVRWRLLEGLSFKEIALRQGVPLNTALGRMHRGLKHIRTRLTDHELIEKRSTT